MRMPKAILQIHERSIKVHTEIYQLIIPQEDRDWYEREGHYHTTEFKKEQARMEHRFYPYGRLS